jgi:hypothetical protein
MPAKGTTASRTVRAGSANSLLGKSQYQFLFPVGSYGVFWVNKHAAISTMASNNQPIFINRVDGCADVWNVLDLILPQLSQQQLTQLASYTGGMQALSNSSGGTVSGATRTRGAAAHTAGTSTTRRTRSRRVPISSTAAVSST